jgi:hypothetical protein
MMKPRPAWPRFWERMKHLMINLPKYNIKPVSGDKDPQDSVTTIGRRLPALVCLAALLALLVLSGCSGEITGSPSSKDQVQHQNNGEDETVMEDEKYVLETAKPPIDLDVPPALETATLAMG